MINLDLSYIDKNLLDIRNNISAAAEAAGRDISEITLLAATKYACADEINYVHKHCGVNVIGENRVQHLLEHYDNIDKDGLSIHFIGSLQKNKVKYIIDKVSLIHSLDSLSLACEIDKQAKKKGIIMNALIEINSGMEESKGGVMPNEVSDFARSLSEYENIKVCGFMTMAPKGSTADEYREYFSTTKCMCDNIWYNELKNKDKPIYSMGMSESYMTAIECGANIVRLGSIIFKCGKPE